MEDRETRQAQTLRETDRKCPQCGGTLSFAPGSAGLACPYCGHTEVVTGEVEIALEQDFAAAESTQSFDWGANKKTLSCKACGAESIFDELQVSNSCPYCGSNLVTEAAGANAMAPGGVCPFEVTGKRAAELFLVWIKRRFFCPRKVKKNVSPEAFNGVYLPYWTFDCQTHSRFTAEYGITRTVHHGKTTTTHTTWHRTSGEHASFIDDQAVLASTRHDPQTLQKIEPFRTGESRVYRPEYVAGFVSERYSIGLTDGWEKGKALIAARLQQEISAQVKRRHHADQVRNVRMNTIHSEVKYKCLLLPLWLSAFTYRDKPYRILVNGQTGKVGGKTPVSALRVALVVAAGIAVIWLISRFM